MMRQLPWFGLLVLGVLAISSPTAAQCGGHGGGAATGSHDHSQSTSDDPRVDRTIKKADRAVSDLLADPVSRDRLLRAVIGDAALLEDLLDRVLAEPEWRSWIADEVRRDGVPAVRPAAEELSYVCPMHPEVRASNPGTCRICGMALERAD